MADSYSKKEQDIVREVVRGNQAAFRELYDAYADKVYYFALRFLKSGEKAEDITQEVFVKLWEARERLDPENSFNAYIFTITRNTIFNVHRKKLNELAYLESLNKVFLHSESKTEQDFSMSELQSLLDRSVEQLPAQRRKVFKMSRTEGLSHKEISQQLGIAEKTIATHIRLALKTLRDDLREYTVCIFAIAVFFISIVCSTMSSDKPSTTESSIKPESNRYASDEVL